MFIKMKKLIFTMLMVLCGITAAMAQDPNVRENVNCGDQMTLKATPAAHYYFWKWEVYDNAEKTQAINTYTEADANCVTDANGVNKLTINMPGYDVWFEAFFRAYGSYTVNVTVKDYTNPDNPITDNQLATITGDGVHYANEAKPELGYTINDDCYEVIGWFSTNVTIPDASKTDNPLTFGDDVVFNDNVDYNFELRVRKKQHTITISSNGNGVVEFE